MPLFSFDNLKAFLILYLFSFAWSAAFLTQDVALDRFGLAVTFGVALAAILPFSIFYSVLSFGTVGFILFFTLSIFSCTHLFIPYLSSFHENHPLVIWERLLWKLAVDIVVLCLWFSVWEHLKMYFEDLLEEEKLGQKSFCRGLCPVFCKFYHS